MAQANGMAIAPIVEHYWHLFIMLNYCYGGCIYTHAQVLKPFAFVTLELFFFNEARESLAIEKSPQFLRECAFSYPVSLVDARLATTSLATVRQ